MNSKIPCTQTWFTHAHSDYSALDISCIKMVFYLCLDRECFQTRCSPVFRT